MPAVLATIFTAEQGEGEHCLSIPHFHDGGQWVKGFKEFFDYADKMSPLGNASAEACADYCVFLFSDLSRMVTMQNLYHDGGFSNMGMNPAVLGLYHLFQKNKAHPLYTDGLFCIYSIG